MYFPMHISLQRPAGCPPCGSFIFFLWLKRLAGCIFPCASRYSDPPAVPRADPFLFFCCDDSLAFPHADLITATRRLSPAFRNFPRTGSVAWCFDPLVLSFIHSPLLFAGAPQPSCLIIVFTTRHVVHCLSAPCSRTCPCIHGRGKVTIIPISCSQGCCQT